MKSLDEFDDVLATEEYLFADAEDLPCRHDYEHPVRKGRAHYVCRKCGADITLELAMILEVEKEKK